ncbi:MULTISPECIES: carboxylate--amine ligase [unclassified Brachybacterium]|uniref:carboxylate--amine ligase n=1 Tax=unclassified Brachybacterium TaxID=2623841 RepID=UPI000C7F7BE4|nr:MULTISPECIES: carboxylate--amine ligase [unclassified Brachybacterium]PMC75148.1 carboxylate--amine ligase [Brachybacterium sp. UMB0905]
MTPTTTSPHSARPTTGVDLVLLGGDIGIYALARAFHERYGITSTVITRKVAGPVADSSILRTVELGMEASEAQMLAALLEEGRNKASRPDAARPILLANADFLVTLLARHRRELAEFYHLPLLGDEVLAAVADKAEFTRLCTEIDVPTPRTEVLDFSPGTAPEVPAELDLGWPLVAKASRSSAYNAVSFPGKRKVFEIHDRAELEELVQTLTAAGYRDRFVLQEMIPGDDTCMLSVTAYVDSRGEVTMLGGAQVLLEEHTPGALGNPAAMFTTELPDVFDQSVRFLEHTGYRGFANFDVKVDPRDGVAKFFEVNPRIGRNNYYMTAAGANVAEPVVADLIERTEHPRSMPHQEVLYSIVPWSLLRRYIVDADLRARVRAIGKQRTVHPLAYSVEGMKRRLYVAAAMANQIKKFLQHYPRPTTDGF